MRLTKREVVAVVQLVVADGAVVSSVGVVVIVILDISFLSALLFKIDGATSFLDDHFLSRFLLHFLRT
jgi:hypothetical protein